MNDHDKKGDKEICLKCENFIDASKIKEHEE